MADQKETFLLKVRTCQSTFTLLSGSVGTGDDIAGSDEYIVTVLCELVGLPKRHKSKHAGKVLEFCLISSDQYNDQHKAAPNIFGSLTLWGKDGSGFIYMPAARLTAVEQNVRASIFKYVELATTPLKRGRGRLTMVHFSEEPEADFSN